MKLAFAFLNATVPLAHFTRFSFSELGYDNEMQGFYYNNFTPGGKEKGQGVLGAGQSEG
jgi:hypothetical protein